MKYILEHEDEASRLEFQATIPQYSLVAELDKCPIKPGDKILDAGCGSGLLSRYLFEKHSKIEVHACDYSELRLAEAKKNSKKPSDHTIKYFHEDLQQMTVSDAQYDVVASRYVMEHLSDPQKAIKELFRVLRPGGSIYIIDFDGIFVNLFSGNEEFNVLLEQVKKGIRSDLYVGHKLPGYLKQAGFEDIDYTVSAIQFKGDDMSLEYVNNQRRCQNCMNDFSRILGSQGAAEKFCKLYLEESMKEGNSLFYNKFIVTGKKPLPKRFP